MASEVMVRASAGGQLILQIRADMAKVSTRFKDLNVAHFDGEFFLSLCPVILNVFTQNSRFR